MQIKKIITKKVKTKKQLKQQLWNVFSKYIRLRDKGQCFTCNKKDYITKMQAGHYISRVYNATFIDERNVHCQCYRCNIMLKGNMVEYSIKLQKKYGYDIIQKLDIQKNIKFKFDNFWLLQNIVYYKNKVKELENDNIN